MRDMRLNCPPMAGGTDPGWMHTIQSISGDDKYSIYPVFHTYGDPSYVSPSPYTDHSMMQMSPPSVIQLGYTLPLLHNIIIHI